MRVAAVILALAVTLPSPLLPQTPRRSCRETTLPKRLPAAGALLDSARVLRELAATEQPSREMLFSLVYNETDSLPRTRVLEAPSEAAGVILAHALLPQKPTGIWAVRIRVTAGAAPSLAIERSTYCPPVPAQSGRPQGMPRAVRLSPDDRRPTPGSRIRITTEVTISETGAVTEVKLIQQSGIREIDDGIIREMRLRRFLPALVDGVPIPSWYRATGQTLKL